MPTLHDLSDKTNAVQIVKSMKQGDFALLGDGSYVVKFGMRLRPVADDVVSKAMDPVEKQRKAQEKKNAEGGGKAPSIPGGDPNARKSEDDEDELDKAQEMKEGVKTHMDHHNRSTMTKGEGEGSRGGHIIGHTKGGEPIYGEAATRSMIGRTQSGKKVYGQVDVGAYSDFGGADHHDAAALHAALGGKQTAGSLQHTFHMHHADVHTGAAQKMDHHNRSTMVKKGQGGEGSRGGKVIGRTKSGHAVYATGNKGAMSSGWSHQDHREAADAHDKARQGTAEGSHEETAHAEHAEWHEQRAHPIEKSGAFELVDLTQPNPIALIKSMRDGELGQLGDGTLVCKSGRALREATEEDLVKYQEKADYWRRIRGVNTPFRGSPGSGTIVGGPLQGLRKPGKEGLSDHRQIDANKQYDVHQKKPDGSSSKIDTKFGLAFHPGQRGHHMLTDPSYKVVPKGTGIKKSNVDEALDLIKAEQEAPDSFRVGSVDYHTNTTSMDTVATRRGAMSPVALGEDLALPGESPPELTRVGGRAVRPNTGLRRR